MSQSPLASLLSLWAAILNSRRKVYLSKKCGRLLVRLSPDQVGMFRFLLEARDNLAVFTALDRQEALLKLMFAPENRQAVIQALSEINEDIPLEWTDWPVS